MHLNLHVTRKDNDRQKMEALQTVLDKYGIKENDYLDRNRDHQRIVQDEREQQEHMSKKKN